MEEQKRWFCLAVGCVWGVGSHWNMLALGWAAWDVISTALGEGTRTCSWDPDGEAETRNTAPPPPRVPRKGRPPN